VRYAGAAGSPNEAERSKQEAMNSIRGIARRLIAGWFIAEGVEVLRRPEPHAEIASHLADRIGAATPVHVSPTAVARVAGGNLAAAGVLVALGLAPRAAGTAAALVLAPATVTGYRFWAEKDAGKRRELLSGFLTHAALTGAALLIAADTSRRDARRLAAARHTAKSQG
jgi:uncharacterized membrane protein YphA (DoxX/SURF4 family)